MNFRRDEHLDALPPADAAHPESSLRVVSKRHVFAEGERRRGGRRLLNVDAGGVHLVVEGEAAGRRQPALLQLKHLHALTHQDHLATGRVHEDDAVRVLQPGLQQLPGHVSVGQASD
eukprot:scaffold4107_cov95-Isochrysis_galbana.AAC.3